MEPCLDWILEAWPRAPAAALLAFSAFLADSEAAFFSLPSLMAAWRAAERASGRWARRSLITSSEAPTMARCCLTVRRVRFLATSWWGVSDLTSCVEKHVARGSLAAERSVFTSSHSAQERSSLTDSVPQRYPSCAASCRGWSTRSCEGSCAAGTETRSCRSGSGRSCCHHGCRACPVSAVSTVLRLPLRVCRHSMVRGPAVSQSPTPCALCSCGAWARCGIAAWAGVDGWGARGGTHLARVDLLAGEGVVVGTHVGGVGGYLGLVGVRRRLDVRQFALGRGCRGRSDALLAER